MELLAPLVLLSAGVDSLLFGELPRVRDDGSLSRPALLPSRSVVVAVVRFGETVRVPRLDDSVLLLAPLVLRSTLLLVPLRSEPLVLRSALLRVPLRSGPLVLRSALLRVPLRSGPLVLRSLPLVLLSSDAIPPPLLAPLVLRSTLPRVVPLVLRSEVGPDSVRRGDVPLVLESPPPVVDRPRAPPPVVSDRFGDAPLPLGLLLLWTSLPRLVEVPESFDPRRLLAAASRRAVDDDGSSFDPRRLVVLAPPDERAAVVFPSISSSLFRFGGSRLRMLSSLGVN